VHPANAHSQGGGEDSNRRLYIANSDRAICRLGICENIQQIGSFGKRVTIVDPYSPPDRARIAHKPPKQGVVRIETWAIFGNLGIVPMATENGPCLEAILDQPSAAIVV